MFISSLSLLLATATCFAVSDDARKNAERLPSTTEAVAGDYYFGDGKGLNCSLTIKAEGRFSFSLQGCLGVYGQNEGEARVEAGHLILKPERPNVREGFQGTATDFFMVRWGERLYLVPEPEAKEFCNKVNKGSEPRTDWYGRFYLRQGDWDKKVTGLPSVPKQWDSFILKKPLRGRVIEVLGDDRAWVDFGTEDGVWKGMDLWTDFPGFELVQVVSVEPKKCLVETKYPDLTPIKFQKGQGMRSRLSVE